MFKRLAWILAIAFALAAGSGGNADAAAIYTVKKGDTLYTIGKGHGVSVLSIKKANRMPSDTIYPGQRLVLPPSLTAEEMDLLARLVHAEAKGEPYAGQVAVATVVLNRLDHPDFPKTVKGIIYAKTGGHYAFTPVANGTINEPADESSKRAVKEAIAFRGMGQGSLYFYNPKTSTSKWIFSRTATITIGNHRFAK